MLLVSASLACGDDSPTSGSNPHNPQVTVGDDFFNPQIVTIALGDTVTWVWGGINGHNVRFGGVANAPVDCATIGSGECVRVFGLAKGTFNYLCDLHPGMSGSVRVQ